MFIRVLILDSSWARNTLSAIVHDIPGRLCALNQQRDAQAPFWSQKCLKMTSNDLEMTHFRTKICRLCIGKSESPKSGVPSDYNVFLCNSIKSSWSFGTSDTTAAYASSTTCFWCVEYHHYSIASFGMKTLFYIIDFLCIYIIISTIKRLISTFKAVNR